MDIQPLGYAQSPPPEARAADAPRKAAAAAQAHVQATQPAEQKPEPSPLQLQQALQTINRKLANSTALEFSIDESTGRTVVKVMDRDSGELIRQIPSDAALAIAASIDEFHKGLLLRQEA